MATRARQPAEVVAIFNSGRSPVVQQSRFSDVCFARYFIYRRVPESGSPRWEPSQFADEHRLVMLSSVRGQRARGNIGLRACRVWRCSSPERGHHSVSPSREVCRNHRPAPPFGNGSACSSGVIRQPLTEESTLAWPRRLRARSRTTRGNDVRRTIDKDRPEDSCTRSRNTIIAIARASPG